MGKNKKTQKKNKKKTILEKKTCKTNPKKKQNEKNICGLSPHILEYY